MVDAIVIPCYNEEARLDTASIVGFCIENPDIVFCFVNDGSQDNTYSKLIKLQDEIGGHVVVENLPQNRGKGEAIRYGVLSLLKKNDPRTIGYWDADLSTPLEAISEFQAILSEHTDVQLVTGCRIKRLGANINRQALRHYVGRLGATLISTKLRVGVYDTQCGAKLFRATTAKKIFGTPFESRWLFDVEIFIRMINIFGIDKIEKLIYEYPLLEWKDQAGSKITVFDYFRCLYELVIVI